MHTRILNPSESSTYRYTDDEWVEICKKDSFTADEIMESTRRNGAYHYFSPEIHISRIECGK